MHNAKQLAQIIIDAVNKHYENYVSEDGKSVITEEMISSLNNILEKGFSLYNYMAEHKLYEGHPELTASMNEVAKYINKLANTKTNAKKLTLENTYPLWQCAMVAVAVMSNSTLDIEAAESF